MATLSSTIFTLVTKKTLSFLGFKAIGIAKSSLAALYQSKMIIISSKSLFALLQSISMKSLIVTYAPIVIPTVVITYAGVKVVMKVV